jgi:diaminopimelate decarboxylase
VPQKTTPFDLAFIENLAQQYPTPFYVYDEMAIRANARRLIAAFDWCDTFKEFFAVKATPNPYLLDILWEEGFGGDCSSLMELILCEAAGIVGEDIMFTSNETPLKDFQKASELGALINLDDISHIDYLNDNVGLPELVCFRYNPGPARQGNAIIGTPEEAKYGLTREQLFEGYARLKEMGVKRFGLHTMVVSNELDAETFLETARMLFELAVELFEKLEIRLDFINLGGGIGIPYRPEQEAVDIERVGNGVRELYEQMVEPAGIHPLKIYMENGRMVTGPYGYLVTKTVHRKDIYKQYVGVDGCMANLMRPGMYGAYHHITVLGKEDAPHDRVYDVVGSLCENNDKFAIDRTLPEIAVGDYVVLHDAGAHGHSMGFQYNGKLRCAELLLKRDGSVQQIRRAETAEDYFATLDYAGLRAGAESASR